jgi:hypothetical protein
MRRQGRASGGTGLAMKTIATLLARKRQLIDRLQEDPGPHERDEIDRLMAQINRALDDLDEAESRDDPKM